MTDVPSFVPIGLALAVGAIGLGVVLIRTSGARIGMGRRLAGAREHRVGSLLDLGAELPGRAVRVAGRIRCPDPIITARDDRLVVLHRDVEVRLRDGGWRTIERLRASRGFELWDHDGSLPLDPAQAAEPLVTLPHVWRGGVDELGDPGHRAAVERLRREGGAPVAARSVTRMISVVDRLLVLGEVRSTDGGDGVALVPPPGGYVISTLDLPDAMRLLGGERRGRLLAGAASIVAGALIAAATLVSWLLA